MSARTSERRKQAFFTARAETGNQTISAERARVSRSWVSLHRSTDPEFKARMEVCIAEARARLSSAGAVKPSRKWANIDGEELVVRGSRGRRAQISRARLKQWTLRGEARFLSVLRKTCNLELACRAVGLSVPSVYKHAERWPRFAEAWTAALEEGYHALELAMLENGIRSLDPHADEEMDWEPAIVMEPMTPEQAFRLLHMNKHSAFRHWAQKRGLKGWGRNPNAEMSDAEVTQGILKKLSVLKRRMDAGQA